MLGQRLRELSQSDPRLAHELAREAVRNDSLVEIRTESDYVVVEKERFKGVHDLMDTEFGWQVSNRGEYEVLIDDVDLNFTIQTIDANTLSCIKDELSNLEPSSPTPSPDGDDTNPLETAADGGVVTESETDIRVEPRAEDDTGDNDSVATTDADQPSTEEETDTQESSIVNKVMRFIGR